MRQSFRALSALALGLCGVPAFAQLTGPSSSQSAYVVPARAGVVTRSLLTVGDSIDGYQMVGIPDGLGAFSNGDGTFTLLMNHELGNTSGAVRAHGSAGSFVSRWTVNSGTGQVTSGSDQIRSISTWNTATSSYNAPATGVTLNRLCSGDLASAGAYFNSATGLGTTARLFLSGEESGAEGRVFAHVATGANQGVSYQLPRLGRFSWENAVANPNSGNKTIVIGTDDATPGQVYVYVGDKTATGNEIERAGLTNGQLFGVRTTPRVEASATGFGAASLGFSLTGLGDVSNTTGATLQTNSTAAGITEFLRPEDGAWDPRNPSDFYFVTTNSFNNPSRLWRLRFDNVFNPTGGILEMLLDGTEGQQMLDNICIDRFGNILLQEDPGNNSHIAKVWNYNIAGDSLSLLAQHDSSRFLAGGANFLTQDEESSGIVDASEFFGEGWFLMDVQAHYANGSTLVEGGQLLALYNPFSTAAAAAAPEPSTIALATLGFFGVVAARRRKK